MCGICGLINKDGSPVDDIMLGRMTRILAHRGPDGEGLYKDGHVGLGHRRLAIIDLSEDARQPMLNEDGSIALVFNGMIYNYPELTSELKAKGHKFRSKSDTEVIIHLYEEYGPDCVKRLRGMFAFAIWDKPKRELLLARDRIGQKPLVYALNGKCFIFASEVKSILASEMVKPEEDPLSFHKIFSYKTVPYPFTMFKGIYKLPPASIMRYSDGNIKIEKYWAPNFQDKISISAGDATDRLRELMDESVKLRLMSNVPVGAFLSGGIDSSLVTVFINHNTSRRLKAFSVGFEKDGVADPEFGYAGSVARRYNLEHRKVVINEDILEEMGKTVWHYDEPFPVPEALVNMRFCREIKKEVTTALTGDGADELFAGYAGYFLWKTIGDGDIFLRRHPVARYLVAGLNRLVRSKGLDVLLLPPEEKRAFIKRRNADRIARSIYPKKFEKESRSFDVGYPMEELYRESSPSHLLDGVLYTDLLLNDAHGVCTFSDISGMANGLEVRSPFLDHKIVEFAASLPVGMKISGMERKYVLKRLAQSLLPEEVLSRKKLGYGEGIPLRRWFLKEWRNRVENSIFNGSWNESGFVDEKLLKGLCESNFSGKRNDFDMLWTIFCYSEWHRVFFKEFDKQSKGNT